MLSTLCTQTDFKSKVYEDRTLDIFCDDIKTSSSEVDSLKTDDEESRLRENRNAFVNRIVPLKAEGIDSF